jgi:hypothetical protein
MKPKLAALLFVLLSPCAHSQGTFVFGNVDLVPVPPVTISAAPGTFNPPNGPAGAYVGSDYTASLLYLGGTISDKTTFDSSNPIPFLSADIPFLGTTGFTTVNGAGQFDGGIVYLPTNGVVTVQVRVWYNGGGLYTSYAQAQAGGQNVGESNPVSLYLSSPLGNPPYMDGLMAFSVGIVPEPSTFVLFGLGGVMWLTFRRRKNCG